MYKSLLFTTLFSVCLIAHGNDSDGKLTKENIDKKTDAEIKERVEFLENRLNEIKEVDFSTLEKSEKRALKEEIKKIKKEMALDARITISIGAAILIILLLILLL